MRLISSSRTKLLMLFTALAFVACGCGGDEPDDDTDKVPIENPDDSTGNDNDLKEPDQVGPSIDRHPSAENLIGAWRVDQDIITTYTCFNGKWSVTDKETLEGTQLTSSIMDRFPYFIGFINYDDADHSYDWMIWGATPVIAYNDVVSTIREKGNKIFGRLTVTDGMLSGDYYDWSIQTIITTPNDPGRDMVMLKKGSEVEFRWEITKFDGDSFYMADYFQEMPRPVEGSMHFVHTRHYVKI